MAATHYQIFYRYVSPETNVPITNDLANEYEEMVEIVHQKHKLYAGSTEEQLEAEQSLNNMIIEQTTPATCPKYDMMFAFNGAKKYYHKNWKNGQWTNEVTAIPDGVVAVKEYGGEQILHENKDSSGNYRISVYSTEETPLPQKGGYIVEGNVDLVNHPEEAIPANSLANFEKLRRNFVIQERIDNGEEVDQIRERTYSLRNDNAYPYVVKDSYIRIPMSPWIKGAHCGSLESAIEKCKTLVGMIGMENVKLVKIVDIRQKIRIN